MTGRMVGRICCREDRHGVHAFGYAVSGGVVLRHRTFVPWFAVAQTPGEVAGIEVGRFGSRLVRLAKKVAKNKVVRGIVKVAMKVVEATPYGAAAKTAINLAKTAVKAIKGGKGGKGRGAPARGARGASRGRRRPGQHRRPQGRPTSRARRRPGAAVAVDPVAARILASRGVSAVAKVRMLRALAGV